MANNTKRTYGSDNENKIVENLEVSKRLYRSITDISKKLDDARNSALTIHEIFTPINESLRNKLKEYCERLLLLDPIRNVQKVEELLWRKAFYDIINTAKKLRKGNKWNELEEAYLMNHYSIGIGYYHNLILNLQMECDLDMGGLIDFSYPVFEMTLSDPGIFSKSPRQKKPYTEEEKKAILRFIHRSLICIGDLNRYKLDIRPDKGLITAIRFYRMALFLDPKHGMPHNQLGTVSANRNFGLDAVYYYMRCSLCAEPFEGSEANLKRVITVHSSTGKEKSLVHCCISKLLLLLQLWDNEIMNNEEINKESQSLLNDIEACLNMRNEKNLSPNINGDSIENQLSTLKLKEVELLSDDMIFKITMICVMMIMKIQKRGSTDYRSVLAFMLAVLSQLLQFFITRLQNYILETVMTAESIQQDFPIVNNTNNSTLNKLIHNSGNSQISNYYESQDSNINKNEYENGIDKKKKEKSRSLLTKLRRPRKRKNSSDSEGSEDSPNHIISSDDEINSDISETEVDLMSDDVLSDELTDDEQAILKNADSIIESEVLNIISSNGYSCTKNMNGHQINSHILPNENQTNSCNFSTSQTPENKAINTDYVGEMKKMVVNSDKLLNYLGNEKVLISIKICCDWLRAHPDVIRTCAKASKMLLKRLVNLQNLLNFDVLPIIEQLENRSEIFHRTTTISEIIDKVPLPEETDLKGLPLFDNLHRNLNWELVKKMKIGTQEETLLRCLKIAQFGHYLIFVEGSGVKYNEELNLFTIPEQEHSPKSESPKNGMKVLEIDQSKGELMRHMGKLWLTAEVKALENRLHSRLMSPYLVPDHEAFSKYMPLIKSLVYSKKFVVIIPSVVICALDEMKRISIHARETTRWLENQLKRGSRFLRPQRPQETLSLPLIKGPKPKDKEAWLYFRIIECCHYLTQQNKAGAEVPVVTLLTGADRKLDFSFNPEGLAKSAGVEFEHINAFHTKWKSSTKSHG